MPCSEDTPDHPSLTTRFDALAGEGAEIVLLGRLVSASNQTFLARVGPAGSAEDPDALQAVYKPVAGERPLWDFPGRVLGARELAAYRLSDRAGFHLVPYTAWVDGPLGPGSLQVWVDDDPDEAVIDLAPTDEVRPVRQNGSARYRRFGDLVRYEGREWFTVLDGLDGRDAEVSLLHLRDDRLRAMALFDAVINNADRKGAHILASQGRLFGVDHGISFHPENKLRTLLWGWAGEELTEAELGQVRRAGALADELADLLGEEDTEALVRRCSRLEAAGSFPRPSGSRHTIPWPPW